MKSKAFKKATRRKGRAGHIKRHRIQNKISYQKCEDMKEVSYTVNILSVLEYLHNNVGQKLFPKFSNTCFQF